MDPKLEDDLVRFKRARDGVVHADADELEHHLREFIRELRRNPLTTAILDALPKFDANDWWRTQVGDDAHFRRPIRLDFPEGEDERLVVLLDLAESMASDDGHQLSVRGFGSALGKHKFADSAAVALSLVIRPLAELLGDRIRKRVETVNPAVRELAGVPLERIPSDDEILIFLSHKTVNKPLVEPFYELLKEIGFSPWLDKKDMRAGDTLHREITAGFDRSCAVVFFVTKDFRDERWLAHELDQAVSRKIERGDRFRIISLVFDGAEVPRPLQSYLYINVVDTVQAAAELVRALPIQVGPPRWRE